MDQASEQPLKLLGSDYHPMGLSQVKKSPDNFQSPFSKPAELLGKPFEPMGLREEPTEGQISSAKLSSYLREVGMIGALAREHVSWKTARSSKPFSQDEQNTIFNNAYEVLYDLYFHPEKREETRLSYMEEADVLEGLLNKKRPELVLLQQQELNKASDLSVSDRLGIVTKAVMTALAHPSMEEKVRMLEVAGVSRKDLVNLKNSGLLAGAVVVPLEFAVGTLGSAMGATLPLPGDISDPLVQLAIAIAMSANIGLTLVTAARGVKTIKEAGYSNNPMAVFAHFLLRETIPENIRFQDLGTFVTSAATFGVFEAVQFGEIFIPGVGPLIHIGRNAAGAVAQVIQMAVNEFLIYCAKHPEVKGRLNIEKKIISEAVKKLLQLPRDQDNTE